MCIVLAGTALAEDSTAGKSTVMANGKKAVHHAKKAGHIMKAGEVKTGSALVRKGPLEVAPTPIPSCSAASAAALDKTYNFKGWWALHFPSFGDSIAQDYGCWRSNLASYGFGLIGYQASSTAGNALTHSSPPTQSYWGQRTSALNGDYLFLTYDLGHIGIQGGQFQVAAAKNNTTYIGFFPNNLVLNNLGYYQSLFGGKLEFRAGIIGNNYSFFGIETGSSLTNPFGPSAAIPALLGVSQSGQPAPGADVRWNITDRFYEQFGVQRSLVPALDPVLGDHYANPSAIAFTEHAYIFGNQFPASGAIFFDEVGYRNAAAPNDPQTWIRAGGFYNDSKFYNFKTQGVPSSSWVTGTTDTYAFYLLADRQIWQIDPSSPATAYRGVYAGFSAMYAPPETTIFSQYYEARVYSFGLFDTRPFDMASFVFVHQVISNYFADETNALEGGQICHPLAITCARHTTNSATVSYSIRLSPGVYLTPGIQYTDHPATTYIPAGHPNAINHDLNVLASLFLIF
jgi:porin